MTPTTFARLVEEITGEPCSRQRAAEILKGRSIATRALRILLSRVDVLAVIQHIQADTGYENENKCHDVTDAELRSMMRDPRYWRDHDPDFVTKVHDGFRHLYGSLIRVRHPILPPETEGHNNGK